MYRFVNQWMRIYFFITQNMLEWVCLTPHEGVSLWINFWSDRLNSVLPHLSCLQAWIGWALAFDTLWLLLWWMNVSSQHKHVSTSGLCGDKMHQQPSESQTDSFCLSLAKVCWLVELKEQKHNIRKWPVTLEPMTTVTLLYLCALSTSPRFSPSCSTSQRTFVLIRLSEWIYNMASWNEMRGCDTLSSVTPTVGLMQVLKLHNAVICLNLHRSAQDYLELLDLLEQGCPKYGLRPTVAHGQFLTITLITLILVYFSVLTLGGATVWAWQPLHKTRSIKKFVK